MHVGCLHINSYIIPLTVVFFLGSTCMTKSSKAENSAFIINVHTNFQIQYTLKRQVYQGEITQALISM